MTENEKILLVMGWTIPFHGMSPEDGEFLAREVLDAIDWDLESVSPADLIHKTNKICFQNNELGKLSPTDAPSWEDYGCVRPPVMTSEKTGSGYLSDGTPFNAHDLAAYLSEASFQKREINLEEYCGIDFETGNLHLLSGGVVPPVSEEIRSVVWPAVFANPHGFDQEAIDELIANPPATKSVEEKSFIEQESERVYKIIELVAQDYKETINQDYEKTVNENHAATGEVPHTH